MLITGSDECFGGKEGREGGRKRDEGCEGGRGRQRNETKQNNHFVLSMGVFKKSLLLMYLH